MAKLETEKQIQIKVGLSLSKLLDDNKKSRESNIQNGIEDESLIYSLGKISIDTGLRVATLSDIFSGKSNPKAATIDTILTSLGKTFSDFANYYDKLNDKEIKEFAEKQVEKTKQRK